MLALHCRAENNKLYIKKNIEMRPGFLAKWIECHIYSGEGETVLEKMKKRIADSRPCVIIDTKEEAKSDNEIVRQN